ncbi:hypothetical protein MASR2M17_11680 [Aminivibrio sp.]
MVKNIIGIIAEYNPLHYGHVHHISEAARQTGASGIVVVLSSYFTQRGEPALLSKWDRAEMALRAGANLVLELPVFFSCASAGVFAGGGIDLLAAAGVVNTVTFGMEDPGFSPAPILDILIHEPSSFKDYLKKYMKSGFSYVKARARALGDFDPAFEAFVSRPNNSLALSYMQRVLEKQYPLAISPGPAGRGRATAPRRSVRPGQARRPCGGSSRTESSKRPNPRSPRRPGGLSRALRPAGRSSPGDPLENCPLPPLPDPPEGTEGVRGDDGGMETA